MSTPSRIPTDYYGWRSVRDLPTTNDVVIGFYCCDDKPDSIIMQTAFINGIFEDALDLPEYSLTHWQPLLPAPQDWEDKWWDGSLQRT